MPDEYVTRTGGPGDTASLGEALGRLAGPGDFYCLYGELGAGKTTFVQGLARGLGVPDSYITSPTYSLVNEYHGALTLHHIDLYRLNSLDELTDIGFSEYPGGGVAAVEWPERASGELPPERLELRFSVDGENERTITVTAHGERYQGLLEGLCHSTRWSRRSA